MEIRKIIISGLLLFWASGIVAQKHPVFYTGIDFYRQGSFDANYFSNFTIGSQLYQFKFLVPEIGYSTLFGSLPEREIYKNPAPDKYYPDAFFHQSFSTSELSLTPKLKFGKEDAFLVILPTYHIGNVKTKATYYTPSSNKSLFKKEKYKEVKNRVSYWSFAVGFEGIYISPHFWFGLTFDYIQLHIQENWDALNFSEYDVKAESPSTTTIGFGFRIYYDPFANEND